MHESLPDIPEGQLVKKLLADPYWRARLFGLAGFPRDPVVRDEVDLAGVPGGVKGEVDVLLCRPGRPDLAVAVEVKRIKFDAWDIERGSPKKLHEIGKAYEQANRDAGVGFAQVYLYVIVVVDSRELNIGKKQSYEGLSNDHRGLVRRALPLVGLDARVGLFEVELAQTVDNPPLWPSTWGGELRRNAQPTIQTPELTEWVTRKMG
jgi:hypothetical protein